MLKRAVITSILVGVVASQCAASVVRFNAAGEFTGSAYLWGTIDIDTTAGSIVATDMHAGPFRLTQFDTVELSFQGNGFRDPYVPPSGPDWMFGNVTPIGGPAGFTVGFGVAGLIGYAGGPLTIGGGRNGYYKPIGTVEFGYPFDRGCDFFIGLTSGYLTTDPVPPPPPHEIHTLVANGTFADGSALGGTVTVDATIGRILSFDLTRGSTHLTRNYDGQYWHEEIFWGIPGGDHMFLYMNDTSSISLFSPMNWSISTGSSYWDAATNQVIYLNPGGTFTLQVPEPSVSVPEPSSVVLAAIGAVAILFWRRRRCMSPRESR